MIEFSNYLLNYGKEIGLPDLNFNEKGICSLSFDSKINIDIVYRKEQDQCIFAAPIGDVLASGQENFFKRLLIANAFGIENAGAIIGIDEEKNSVVLSYTFIASTFSFDLFKVVLNNFVNMVEEWQDKLVSIESEESSSGAGSAPQPFEYMCV